MNHERIRKKDTKKHEKSPKDSTLIRETVTAHNFGSPRIQSIKKLTLESVPPFRIVVLVGHKRPKLSRF